MLDCDFYVDIIDAMDTSSEWTPEAILSALAAPLATYRTALDDGLSFADLKMHDLPQCPYTWATLTRYWTAEQMVKRSANQPWLVERLNNNGLIIQLDGWTVRFRKSFKAGPPAPGHSVSQQAYYSQLIQMRLFETYYPAEANLILDWDIDASRKPKLAISKTKGLWKFNGIPNLEWRRFVEFPEDGGARFVPSSGHDDDIDVTGGGVAFEDEGDDEAL